MLTLDHLTVIAPNLDEGVRHVRACLDLDVPFGQRHVGMGSCNHLLQLGGSIYLEIVALDPDADPRETARWFGLNDPKKVRREWDAGQRLRGWVARVDRMDEVLGGREAVFGRKVALPAADPSFDFAIPEDGSLPLDGAVPSLIDRRGKARSMANIADLGARLKTFSLEHPDADAISIRLKEIGLDPMLTIRQGPEFRYRAHVETPAGLKELS
ncbi:VOC family protein [Bosea sp. TND4EK4]|uniref:VOC family protein n=1 Tax=Bosea sp. TND4EK4 TaxID=1907408 RepID=UPI000970B100|nr:VOC family protein [Bosea sp. TND4EK4]